MIALVVSWALLLGAAPPHPQEPSLPKLLRLGPVPEAPVRTVTRTDAAVAAVPAGQTAVVLRIDGDVSAQRIAAELRALQAGGVTMAHFAATLPDGTLGAITLALPEDDDPPPTITLRGHHERTGVPAASATPLLRRLADGWHGNGPRPFVLALEVPATTPWHQLAQLLAAAAAADVDSVCLRTGAAETAGTERSLALDLVGSLTAQVVAVAMPVDKPRLDASAFGCLQQAATTAAAPRPNGAGGRFGGRGGAGAGAKGKTADASWLVRQLQADGSLRSASGDPDLEAMALFCLGRLAGGSTLDVGPHAAELQRCLGWIAASQRDDGSFEPLAPGSVQRHAQLTYALAEAMGLSASGDLLRRAAADAIQWLQTRSEQDGGWAAIPGTPSAPIATAWSITALASAAFFKLDAPKAAELVAWFDEHPQERDAAAAAELFCRIFAGQDSRTSPRILPLADAVLSSVDPRDPNGAYWASYALFQVGNQHWGQWQKRITEVIAREQQLTDDGLRGSWTPAAGMSRATTTALNTLTLQVYYRYARLVR